MIEVSHSVKMKNDNCDLAILKSWKTLSFDVVCSINLLVTYVGFVDLLLVLKICKITIFCILIVCLYLGLSGNRLYFGFGYILKTIFTGFYSFEPLSHKPCCQLYLFGISQLSVPSTNIQSVLFSKTFTALRKLLKNGSWSSVLSWIYRGKLLC